MMAEYTENYKLYKPNRLDAEPVDETLSGNFQTIDNELKKRETDISSLSVELDTKTENFQQQLNTMIIESGTSNAETIQARGQFPILNDRLNYFDDMLIAQDVNYLYVDALKSDLNDGKSPETAVKTLRKAFDLLYEMGSKPSFGSWTIKIKGYGDEHTYSACKVSSMPYFNQKIMIEGDVDANGEPTTVFKQDASLGGYYFIGMWIEPGVRFMHVKNIAFKDFSNGFNGYGFLMKNQGYVFLENCRAYNCDCGFAGINNVTISVYRSIAQDCGDVGFKALYSSNATFGSGSGGSLFDDGGNGCKAIRCNKGVFISRNAVAHVDYMNIEDCTYAGVHVEMNSRVAILGSHLKRNEYGVRAEGGAEWINVIEEPNNFYEGTVDKNVINYAHFGNSRESRLYSQRSQNLFRQIILFKEDMELQELTGSTEEAWLCRVNSSFYIPKHFFAYKGRKIKVVVFGTMTGDGNKKVEAVLQGLNDDGSLATNSTVIGVSNYNSLLSNETVFKCEFDLDSKGGNQIQRSGSISYHLQPNSYIYDYETTITTNLTYQLRLRGALTDAESSIKIKKMEFYLMG